MKVLIRILTKLVILVLVIAAAGGGACTWQAYQQSTPEYTMEQYLTCLIENTPEKAYAMLDQSENETITAEEYADALLEQEYSLYSGYQLKNGETKRDADGNEYEEYHVEFLNAADEVKLEADFTVKKQEKAVVGIFDSWKVMAKHCLVQNYPITVPTGAELYLNNELADSSWIVEGEDAAYDNYVIPTLIPGEVEVTIRHAVLASVTETLDVTDPEQNYSGEMELKESAQNECMELGVKALKALFSAAVSDNLTNSAEMFASCMEQAEQYVKEQAEAFDAGDGVFKQVAVSGFAAQFSAPVFDKESGALTTEMTFSYHYVVREDVTYESGDYLEDGSPEYITEAVEHTNDDDAKLTMAYYDGAWHIEYLDIPVVLKPAE